MDNRKPLGLGLITYGLIMVSCAPHEDPTLDAVVEAARLMMLSIPENYEPRLAAEWVIGPNEPFSEDLLTRLRNATQIQLLSDAELESHDPTITILSFARPYHGKADTVEVLGNWIMLTGGDGGGGHGIDFQHIFSCNQRTCELIEHFRSGSWN